MFKNKFIIRKYIISSRDPNNIYLINIGKFKIIYFTYLLY